MSKGAYYQGLVYANKGVKPVNFGALATGIAEQELTKRKDREEFELKIAENYGDVIYPAFDGTGLENADMYQRSVADLISARAQDLNDRFNNKEINKVQYTREMAKLKGQTQQLVSSFGKIEDFVKKVNELGGDADPKTLEMVEELELLFKNAKPYLDENNSLGNFSVDEEGKSVRSFLWSNVNKRLIAEKRYDVNTIPKLILGVQGDLSKFIANDKIIATLLDSSGELKSEQTNLIANLVKSMSNTELTSYAEQVLANADGEYQAFDDQGKKIDGQFSPLDITDVEDKEALQDLVVEDLTDRTKSFLSQKTKTDEVEIKELNLKIRESHLRQLKLQKDSGDDLNYIYELINNEKNVKEIGFPTVDKDGTPTQVQGYTLKNPKTIKFVDIEGSPGSEGLEGVQSEIVLKQMYRDGPEGDYYISVGYLEYPDPAFKDPTTAIPQQKNIKLKTRQQKNFFIAQFDQLRPISDTEEEVNSNDSLGIIENE